MATVDQLPTNTSQRSWNRGALVGQKRPLLPKHVWLIRVRLEMSSLLRDLAFVQSKHRRPARSVSMARKIDLRRSSVSRLTSPTDVKACDASGNRRASRTVEVLFAAHATHHFAYFGGTQLSKTPNKPQATSTEITGGYGFTYEDAVVAYYLASLLREEGAALQSGVVKSVAVQQSGHDRPMDDMVVEFEDDGTPVRLDLQIKTSVSIGSGNKAFQDVVTRAKQTRAAPAFKPDRDRYGFAAEKVAVAGLQSLQRLTEWAKASPDAAQFERRFEKGGAAAKAEREMRDDLGSLVEPKTADEEWQFYRQFVAARFDGLNEGGFLRTEIVNRLRDIVEHDEGEQAILLFDRLCRLVRDGAATAAKWTRASLLAQLRGAVRLTVAPNYKADVDRLQVFSKSGINAISERIGGVHVERPNLEDSIRQRLTQTRVVNISGLPGCGKSAVLRRIAAADADKGPIVFLKSDLLVGTNWLTFATGIGLKQHTVGELLAEIGATGTPTLFIDGIDRIRPDQRGIITDILTAIESDENLSNWKVLASSRDQGLEAYRAWFPTSFYRGSFIGDVPVASFDDDEATLLSQQVPVLSRLLFGPPSIAEIARRPFFAAVLARSFPEDVATPQTEVDLIAAWWGRGGHNADDGVVPQRQRALLDLAEQGVANLGKGIAARSLRDATITHLHELTKDQIVRTDDQGASYSFRHDIFFEWVFFRHLIALGEEWAAGLSAAGEPPLLGRVVGLLAQSAFARNGSWSSGYRHLAAQALRSQWQREWLTAPPFSTTFKTAHAEFAALLAADDYLLLEKLLVWFQAQHTIPNPLLLQNPTLVQGADAIGTAEYLSWPSDFESWGRLLDWLLGVAPTLRARLIPSLLEVFGVWQNVFSDIRNPRSAQILDICSAWLIELEGVLYSDRIPRDHGRWDALSGEARKSLATFLRMTIMRSARAYPAASKALFGRAIENERMRVAAYSDLMGFTPTMVDVAPDLVVAVAKAELMKELPQERLDREERERRDRFERIKRLRAIPENERTEAQRRALDHVPFLPSRSDRIDFDDIGLSRHHSYYHPPSALHEPFATLFAKRPDFARVLVRDLANHATMGWRQTHTMNPRESGTPIPIEVEFPWGKQQFWGDWHVYNWFMGQLAPQTLECAYLALSYWAFKQLEAGRAPDEVIREVLEGHECYATLGLALVLALEAFDVSDTTLPIVSCQRLWEHDIARVAHEPARGIDIMGFGSLNRLTGAKAEAKSFLDSRETRKRDIRELAMRFALTKNEALRERFRDALAAFPGNLPFDFEEQRTNAEATAHFNELAERWAPLGDISNYRGYEQDDGTTLIGYEPPTSPSAVEEKRLAEATSSLQEYSVIGWANRSLQANTLQSDIELEAATAFAKVRDTATIFSRRMNAGDHSRQTVVAAVAAVIIRLGPPTSGDLGWAWDVMDRVAQMAEPEGLFGGERIPWHPVKHLIVALFQDRRSSAPRNNSVEQLFALTAHPLAEISRFAFSALFKDADEHVRWVAGQLAMELAIHHRTEIDDEGDRDSSKDSEAREQARARALARLRSPIPTPMPDVPPAWAKAMSKGRWFNRSDNEMEWDDADPSFEPRLAAGVFSDFPIEAWCASPLYKPLVEQWLVRLVDWTAERLMPSWEAEQPQGRRESRSHAAELDEWNDVLGDLLARAAPFFDLGFVRAKLLAKFLTNSDEELEVLAEFVDKTVRRQVMDAEAVPANTLALLGDCAERVIHDPVFRPGGYRAGEIHGYDLPKLIKALLFVLNDEPAPGSRRFANGDWSQIGMIMPVVSKLVAAVGWSTFVAQNFLTLCDRAGDAYPVDAFVEQANAVLAALGNAKGSWTGTVLPARIAAIVQRLADANYPLQPRQAQGLLRVLDALIDLGDRRSAALEQTEAFRNIQRSHKDVASVRRLK